MSLLPQATNANATTAYFLKANAQLINVSTLNAGSISTASITTSSLLGQFLSTIECDAEYMNTSTINTLHLDLDGQILTATPTELLLNGIPIATQSSLSSIADWSLDPAISTVQMDGNDLNAAGTISSVNVRSGNGFFQNLIAFNSLFVSTATSTISTSIEFADEGNFSTLNAGAISSGVGTISSLAGDSAQFSTISCDSLSTILGSISSLKTDEIFTSSFTTDTISSNSLSVSSINGSEFTSTGIVVQVAGVSSLVANSISSVGAEIRNALVSTIQFKPSFDVGLNFDTAALGNALQGGLTRLGIGAGVGFGVVGSGLLGAVFSRPSNTSYNTNAYYQYAVPTQLQFSTLGADTSSFTRLVSSSGAANEVPGVEIVLSSIISSGTLCIRSLGDPTNLADPSTFTSSIQAFGEWVPVPPETLQVVSSFATASVSSLEVSSINGLNTASLENISSFNDLYASTISTAVVYGANSNLFGLGIQGLEIQTAPTGQVWISSPQTNIAGLTNTSTLGAVNIQARNGGISSLQVSSLSFAQAGAYGLSSLMWLSTAFNPTQGTSTTLYINTDLTLGQNDIYAQQIRLGRYTTDTTNVPELIMYGDDGSNRGFSAATGDKTVRVYNNTLPLTSTGYILDTYINAPFFSTINNSTCMMAWFPSTAKSTIGISTISIIPPIQVYGGFYSSTTQGVAGANTITPLTYNSQSLNVGGFSFAGSTINVPVAGTYAITHSVQFATTSGGTNQVQFWVLKNGAPLAQTNSAVSIVNNGDTLGTIEVLDTAAANDKYGIAIYSSDANMSATATAAGATPAIPSLITNIKRLG